MSKILAEREGPVLGINSSTDMFEKLRYESSRLRQGWHSYDAFNFLVTAWHLFEDWSKSDDAKALSRSKRQRHHLPENMNLVLDVVRDLVNGSKHFTLTRDAAKKRRIGEILTGKEVGYYQYFFRERVSAVVVDQHWYFSIRALHNLIINYFQWVFDDTTPVKDFPQEITDAISYCHVPSRKGRTPPAIWLEGIEHTRRGNTHETGHPPGSLPL